MTPVCSVCKAPGSWHCQACATVSKRMRAVHGSVRVDLPPAALAEREARIKVYRLRAEARMPLFGGRR